MQRDQRFASCTELICSSVQYQWSGKTSSWVWKWNCVCVSVCLLVCVCACLCMCVSHMKSGESNSVFTNRICNTLLIRPEVVCIGDPRKNAALMKRQTSHDPTHQNIAYMVICVSRVFLFTSPVIIEVVLFAC